MFVPGSQDMAAVGRLGTNRQVGSRLLGVARLRPWRLGRPSAPPFFGTSHRRRYCLSHIDLLASDDFMLLPILPNPEPLILELLVIRHHLGSYHSSSALATSTIRAWPQPCSIDCCSMPRSTS